MLVFPKKPVFDWQNELYPKHPISIPEDFFRNDKGKVYLIPKMGSELKFEKWIEKNYEGLFNELLFGWVTKESFWPKNRNYKMFREWFHVTYHSMVIDVVDSPLEREDEDEENI